jgi:Ni,Fe-hydrogenase III large subunit
MEAEKAKYIAECRIKELHSLIYVIGAISWDKATNISQQCAITYQRTIINELEDLYSKTWFGVNVFAKLEFEKLVLSEMEKLRRI